jgi:hypothetical protein
MSKNKKLLIFLFWWSIKGTKNKKFLNFGGKKCCQKSLIFNGTKKFLKKAYFQQKIPRSTQNSLFSIACVR